MNWPTPLSHCRTTRPEKLHQLWMLQQSSLADLVVLTEHGVGAEAGLDD